jgi:hypothetical protein
MRVRRGLLFWGLFLIPLGAIPLIVRAGQFDASRLVDAWKLWPLIVIGAGVLILFSRTRLAIVGLIVMALTLGTMGGAALASGSFWLGAVGACGIGNDTNAQVDRDGTFSGPAKVSLNFDCGSIDFRAGSDPGWTVHAAYRGEPPTIDASGTALDVRAPSGTDRRQDWTIRAPAATLGSLDLEANAATSTVDLGSANLDRLQTDVNAGDVRVIAGSAGVKSLGMTMNAGRMRLTLGAGSTSGNVSVNAGNVDICVPPTSGLRLDVEEQLTFATNLSSRGLAHEGTIWTRPAQGDAGTIDLHVEGNAAVFNLDPNGGC